MSNKKILITGVSTVFKNIAASCWKKSHTVPAYLSVTLSRVESAGGTVTLPKVANSDNIGFIALVIDTEEKRYRSIQ